MKSVTRVQFLDEAVCVSLQAYELEKNMNSSFLSPATGKYLGWLGSLALIRQPKKKNFELKPASLH